VNGYDRAETALGVDYSIRYNMHTFWFANEGGTRADVGDRTLNPRNMKVCTSLVRSGLSLSNTRMTCWHFNWSSAASNNERKLSREPSLGIDDGSATNRLRPISTASHVCRTVRKVRRNGGGPSFIPVLGTSGPPQRPCAQRHVEDVGVGNARRRAFTI